MYTRLYAVWQHKVLFFKQNLPDSYRELYNVFPNEAFVGYYVMGGRPSYLIRDPELIKKIAIKDFNHFVNRNMGLDHNTEPLLGRSLLMMSGQKWRDMRSTLSPAFTSSKMRLMCSLVSECAEQFCEQLKKEVGPEGHPKEFNFKNKQITFVNWCSEI